MDEVHLNINEAVSKLDDSIDVYSKYTEDNPMRGVSLDKKTGKYVVTWDKKMTRVESLESACKMAIDNMCKKFSQSDYFFNNGNNVNVTSFVYQSVRFISFWIDNSPFFDIRHIVNIAITTDEERCNKYTKLASEIVHRIIEQNRFGGYFFRELINEETLYDVILSSNCPFRKAFAIEVPKILGDVKNTQHIESDTMTDLEILDLKVAAYSKHTETNPMKGVTLDKSTGIFRVNVSGSKLNTKDRDEACKFALGNVMIKFNLPDKKISVDITKVFKYSSVKFVSFWIDNSPFFDIRHIINITIATDEGRCNKYTKLASEIVHRIIEQNRFGGYFFRELINEETLYNVILSSTCSFAKSFKKDVSKILVDLRNKGELIMKTDRISIAHRKSHIDKRVKMTDTEYRKKLSRMTVRPGDYSGIHTIYMALMDLDDTYMVVKVGYTYDAVNRLSTLKSEYGVSPVFIRLAKVNSQQDEGTLHRIMRANHRELVFDMKVGKNAKIELYYMDDDLLKTFDEFVSKLNTSIVTYTPEQKLRSKELKRDNAMVTGLTKRKQADADMHRESEMTKRKELDLEMHRESEMTRRIDLQCKIRLAELTLETKKVDLDIAKSRASQSDSFMDAIIQWANNDVI